MLHACSRAAGSWADRRPRLHLRRQGAKKPAEWLAGLPFGPPKERAINLRAWPQVVPSIPQRWGVQKIALGAERERGRRSPNVHNRKKRSPISGGTLTGLGVVTRRSATEAGRHRHPAHSDNHASTSLTASFRGGLRTSKSEDMRTNDAKAWFGKCGGLRYRPIADMKRVLDCR
jgi:hypothetical protein